MENMKSAHVSWTKTYVYQDKDVKTKMHIQKMELHMAELENVYTSAHGWTLMHMYIQSDWEFLMGRNTCAYTTQTSVVLIIISVHQLISCLLQFLDICIYLSCIIPQ